jgi:hypothetical protein
LIWRGTGDAVAALSGGRFTDEVTDIFTTAVPMLAHRQRVRWGTGDIGFQ